MPWRMKMCIRDSLCRQYRECGEHGKRKRICRFLQLADALQQGFMRRQSLRAGGFPFEVRLEQPNKETIAAMLEAERIARDPSVKHYSDVEEALRELKR